MVQIILRRQSVRQPLSRCSRVLLGCALFVVLACVIPTMFVLRYIIQEQQNNNDKTRNAPDAPFAFLDEANDKTIDHVQRATTTTAPSRDTTVLQQFLHQFLKDNDAVAPGSFVELQHCNLTSVVTEVFWNVVELQLYRTIDGLSKDMMNASEIRDMRQEFLLELLEQYVTFEGLCDYSLYRPTVPPRNQYIAQAERMLLRTPNMAYSHVYIISVYQDINQLNDLIDALYDQRHLIVVHVEAGAAFMNSINDRAMIVSFGTVVYKTDSLSLINLRLLRWLTVELAIQYEYVFLLNGASYPLVHRSELLLLNESVYLGELYHRGEPVNAPSDMLLLHKRLIHSQTKRHKRLPTLFWKQYEIKPSIRSHMVYKSVSGNQGIYQRHVIMKLLGNDLIMELFAQAKFGCCNVLEERTWIAALDILGYRNTALQHPSMFQVWGGAEKCQGSMNNALLSTNGHLCYRSEHPGFDVYFPGNETWAHLKRAKQGGFLFARKFQSDNPYSIDLKRKIREQLWGRVTPS